MKKMIILTIALVVAMAGAAHAVTTTTCYVTVTICQGLAVSLDVSTYNTTVAFGPCVNVNTQNVANPTTERLVVINDSDAGYGDYVLSIDTAVASDHPSEWTVSNTAVGDETYMMYALFNDNVDGSSPGTGDFVGDDVLTEATAVCTDDDTYGEGVATSGYNVLFTDSRGLWFRFDSPTATTRSDEATLPVVVSIQAHQ